MRYVFICDECQTSKEVFRSIKKGPPKKGSKARKCESCNGEMYQDLTGQGIIFKGWFPGEEIKRANDNGFAREQNDERMHDMKRKQQAVDETMEARRKGRKESAEFKKHNQKTWDVANKAMSEGVRPTKKQSGFEFKKAVYENAKKKKKNG